METSQPCPAPVAAAVSTSTGSTICKPSTSVSSATAIGLLKRKLVEVERLRLESESKLKAVEAELAIEKREHTRTTAKLSQLLAKRGAGGAADEQAARDVSALRDAVLTLRRLLHAEREETHRLRAAAAKGPARPAGERHVPLDPQREITPDFSGHASAHAAPRVGSGARGASAQPAARANACNDGERPSAKRSLDVGADAQIAKAQRTNTSNVHNVQNAAPSTTAAPTAPPTAPMPPNSAPNVRVPRPERAGAESLGTDQPHRLPFGYTQGAICVELPKRQRSAS